MNVFVCVTVTVPPDDVVVNVVAVLVVPEVVVLTVVVPVCTVVSLEETVTELVVMLVPRVDV